MFCRFQKTQVRKSTLLAVALLAFASVCVSEAVSQETMFPGRQFGQQNLSPNQSLGGNDDFIAAQQNGVFEPIVEFNANDIIRARSKPVGRLSMLVESADGSQGIGTCTTTLISDDLLITNYHCIPGFSQTDKVIRSVVHFNYLAQDQQTEDVFEVDIQPVDANPDLDYAILRVDGKPGQKFGFVQFKTARVEPNASLYIYHHPAGLPLRVTRFRCRAHAPQAYNGATFRHRCDTLGGSSGALVYDTNHNVVALHHSGGLTGAAASSFNRSTEITAVLNASGLMTKSDPSSTAQAPASATPKAATSLMSPTDLAALAAKNAAKADQASASAPTFSLVDIRRNVSDGYMNVRNGPGLSFAVVSQLPAGAQSVKVFDQSCQQSIDGRTQKPWCRIQWGAVEGWVSSGGFNR
jgi:hypothetical protein